MVDEALAIPAVEEFLVLVKHLNDMHDPHGKSLDMPDHRATRERSTVRSQRSRI